MARFVEKPFKRRLIAAVDDALNTGANGRDCTRSASVTRRRKASSDEYLQGNFIQVALQPMISVQATKR